MKNAPRAKASSPEVDRVRRLLVSMGADVSAEEPLPGCSADSASSSGDVESEGAFARIVSWVNARDRSVAEVSNRLASEMYSSDAVDVAVRRALSCGVLDQERFLRSFVRGKVRLGWGKRKIEAALFEHHLSLSQYPEIEEEFFSAADQLDRARELVAKRPIAAKNPVDKLARFLVGRGFSTTLAYDVARERIGMGVSDM